MGIPCPLVHLPFFSMMGEQMPIFNTPRLDGLPFNKNLPVSMRKNRKNLVLHLPQRNPPSCSSRPCSLRNDDKPSIKEQHMALPGDTPSTLDTSEKGQHPSQTLYEHGPAQILPNLYLGASYNATRAELLSRYAISCVFNVADDVCTPTLGAFQANTSATSDHHADPELSATSGAAIRYYHLPWTHTQNNLANQEFHRAISLLETVHRAPNGVVLIHCQSGIERSAALVIAYVLYLSRRLAPLSQQGSSSTAGNILAGKNFSLWEAYEYVRQRAPGIRPNLYLLYQLSEFEAGVGKLSVTRGRRSGSMHTTQPASTTFTNRNRQRAASFRNTPKPHGIAGPSSLQRTRTTGVSQVPAPRTMLSEAQVCLSVCSAVVLAISIMLSLFQLDNDQVKPIKGSRSISDRDNSHSQYALSRHTMTRLKSRHTVEQDCHYLDAGCPSPITPHSPLPMLPLSPIY